ncbi:ribonuclease H-like protein [Xylaria arbuscula]|nr:ribonuclease H-like protein [Xylaria arbuscula]
MPRGYYLAEGLIPLGDHSSDDDEVPCELPDGRLVCGPHGLVVCYRCEVDYSVMEDILGHEFDDVDSDELDEETRELYRELIPESRAAIDARWGPPSSSPASQAQTYSAPSQDGSSASASRSTTFSPGLIRIPFAYDDGGWFGPKKQRGTGRVFPAKFTPPSSTITPLELFPVKATCGRFTRYIHRSKARCVLIFTDGACLNNGQANPKAGWALVHGPALAGQPVLIASGRLEDKGPFGDSGIQSSNRAELRAVIAALRLRNWFGEGFDTIVVATDSEYVTTGSTVWVKSWVKNDWRTAGKADVKNRDLWEILLGEAERWQAEGLSIQFWKIPREWNEVADAAAKKAAEERQAVPQWTETIGLPIS